CDNSLTRPVTISRLGRQASLFMPGFHLPGGQCSDPICWPPEPSMPDHPQVRELAGFPSNPAERKGRFGLVTKAQHWRKKRATAIVILANNQTGAWRQRVSARYRGA